MPIDGTVTLKQHLLGVRFDANEPLATVTNPWSDDIRLMHVQRAGMRAAADLERVRATASGLVDLWAGLEAQATE